MMGFGKRLSMAVKCFMAVLSRGELSDEVAAEVVKPATTVTLPTVEADETPEREAPPVAEATADTGDRAVQLLALLQRDGRLIDFFSEDIAGYSDAQIGAAARTVHETCRQVLERYLSLQPIIASDEGQPVTVEDDFDPATTKLIGNVTGQPPMQGVLRHRGWRVEDVNLPPLPEGASRAVIAPAEVEI